VTLATLRVDQRVLVTLHGVGAEGGDVDLDMRVRKGDHLRAILEAPSWTRVVEPVTRRGSSVRERMTYDLSSVAPGTAVTIQSGQDRWAAYVNRAYGARVSVAAIRPAPAAPEADP
jgi:hypothetical protein